jgi:hypothetical protein
VNKLRFFVFLLTFSFTTILAQNLPIENGIMDARTFDFTSDRLSLRGSWIWFDNELLSPKEITRSKGVSSAFPKLWNEARASQTGTGYATYILDILVPSSEEEFAIDIPQVYSSYRLWVNGSVVAENGKVAVLEDQSKPQWLPQSASFESKSDTLHLVLQIANFHHHKGGLKDPIYLSSKKVIEKKESLNNLGYWIQFGALFLISIAFLIIYFLYDRKKIIIYFSLLCFSWAVRTLFSNQYLSIQLMPDFDWSMMVRIEYLMLFFTMIWAILYLGRLFPKEGNQIWKYILVTANSLFIAFTILTPPIIFTHWLNIYLVGSGVLLLFATYMVLKALVNEQVGSGLLTFSTLLSLLLFAYDIFTYEGLFNYNGILFSTGYVLLFSLMGFALLLQLNIIKGKTRQTTILTYADLYKDDSVTSK